MPSKKHSEIRRGVGGHEHTEKADRMAEHIERSEEARGDSPERAEEIEWRTVQKDLSREVREE